MFDSVDDGGARPRVECRAVAKTWQDIVDLGERSVPEAPEPEAERETKRRGMFKRLRESLNKSRQALTEELTSSLFDRIDEETRHRVLVLLRALSREIPRMVVVTRGAGVDARPELFDFLLEVRDDGTRTGPLLRPTPAGPGG